MKTIIAITIMLSTYVSTPDLQVWTVEYEGNVYEYVATTYNNPESYIITIDGEKIYVRNIIGGETT